MILILCSDAVVISHMSVVVTAVVAKFWPMTNLTHMIITMYFKYSRHGYDNIDIIISMASVLRCRFYQICLTRHVDHMIQ